MSCSNNKYRAELEAGRLQCAAWRQSDGRGCRHNTQVYMVALSSLKTEQGLNITVELTNKN